MNKCKKDPYLKNIYLHKENTAASPRFYFNLTSVVSIRRRLAGDPIRKG